MKLNQNKMYAHKIFWKEHINQKCCNNKSDSYIVEVSWKDYGCLKETLYDNMTAKEEKVNLTGSHPKQRTTGKQ